MSEVMKVVFVKYTEKARKAYMFECAPNLYLNEGDTVIVLNPDGDEVEATVVTTERFDLKYETDKTELERLLLVAGVEMPFRKIVGKVERTYFKYEEEEDAKLY